MHELLGLTSEPDRTISVDSLSFFINPKGADQVQAIVTNGRCTVHRGQNVRWRPIELPVTNAVAAHMRFGFVAVVLADGRCMVFSQKGEHIHTYFFRDTQKAQVVGRDRIAVVRKRGWTEIYDFKGCQLRVTD